MPARSKAQQRLMAIAEHNPSVVKGKNRGVLKMSHQQLHDFAATKRKGLPSRTKKRGNQHKQGESHMYNFRDHLG